MDEFRNSPYPLQEKRISNKIGVQSQIRSKAEEKLGEHKTYFEEGVKLRLEAEERQRRLEEIKQRKIQELQVCNSLTV